MRFISETAYLICFSAGKKTQKTLAKVLMIDIPL